MPDFGTMHAFVWNHILIGFILMLAGTATALTEIVGLIVVYLGS